jgi:hypothetical protein
MRLAKVPFETDVDLESLARETGAMKPWETLAG